MATPKRSAPATPVVTRAAELDLLRRERAELSRRLDEARNALRGLYRAVHDTAAAQWPTIAPALESARTVLLDEGADS